MATGGFSDYQEAEKISMTKEHVDALISNRVALVQQLDLSVITYLESKFILSSLQANEARNPYVCQLMFKMGFLF